MNVRAALRFIYRSRELRAAIICGVVLFVASSAIVSVRHLQAAQEHLGGENGNIAYAVVTGRGFSDPFAEHTGPTAWMPPALPAFLAALYLLLHTPSLVASAFATVNIALLAATGGIIYRIARERAQALPASLVIVLYLGWVCLFNFYFIILTHDVAVITVLLAMVVWQAHRSASGRQPPTLRWGILGGISLLTSPATAFAWALSGAFAGVLRLWSWRRVAAMVAVAMALGMPWVARNAVVFHRFIPVKSNLYCDLYVANYIDDDGIWDYRSMYVHPYLSVEKRYEYARLGEQKYTALRRRWFLDRLAQEPRRYLGNVWHRALAVSVKYVPTHTEADGRSERRCKRFVHPALFLGALLSLILKSPNLRAAHLFALVWLAFMLPYVAVGLHIRHVLPASFILVLLAFLGIDGIAARIWSSLRARHRASTSPN